MTIKRNWFHIVTLILFEICAVYVLVSGAMEMASGAGESQLLWYGRAAGILAAAFLIVHIIAKILARWNFTQILAKGEQKSVTIERIIVGAALLASAVMQVLAILSLPAASNAYSEAGVLLSNGTPLTSGLLAEFPHIGYPLLLSLLFRVIGPYLEVGLYLNLAAGLGCIYLTYRIVRSLAGRIGGLIVLVAAVCWPLEALYGSSLTPEPLFTFFLLLCIALFIYLYRYPARLGNREGAMFLSVILGILLALANFVRPLAWVFLIAVILCVLPFVLKFNKSEQMLNGKTSRASCQGWFLAIVITFIFLVFNLLLSGSLSPLPGGESAMYGANFAMEQAGGLWGSGGFYLFGLFFAAISGIQSIRRKIIGPEHAFLLLFIGMAVVDLLLKSQPRYHSFLFPIFMIQGAMYIEGAYRGYVARKQRP